MIFTAAHTQSLFTAAQGKLWKALCLLHWACAAVSHIKWPLMARRHQHTTEHMNRATENHLSMTRQLEETKIKYFAHTLKRPESYSPLAMLSTGVVFQREIKPRPPGPFPLDFIMMSKAVHAVGRDLLTRTQSEGTIRAMVVRNQFSSTSLP